MATGREMTVEKRRKQDHYPAAATITLSNLTIANPGVVTIVDSQMALDEDMGTVTATFVGVAGADAADINGARTCTRLTDNTFSTIDTTGKTITAFTGAQTISVQVVAGGAGVILDKGDGKDRHFDVIQ